MREKIYICSPYSGYVKRNKDYARDLTAHAIKSGYAPITPHLYITEVLNDNNPAERAAGIDTAIELLKGCDALLFGSDYGISKGMRGEIEHALALGMPIFAASYKTVNEGGFIKTVVDQILINPGKRCPVLCGIISIELPKDKRGLL